MASLFKRKTDRGVKGAPWRISYTDETGRRRQRVAYADKGESERLRREIEIEVDRRRRGTADPFESHRTRPVRDHLAEFVAHLRDKGNTPAHVALTASRIVALLDGIRADRLGDLDGVRVADWLARRRDEGLSPASSNHYRTAVKGFTAWLVRHRRLPFDPLASVPSINARRDVRVDRGVLTADEFGRLLGAANDAPPFRGLTGRDRALLYSVASYTGLRASELASLTAGSFDLESEMPTVRIDARSAKNRKAADLPLRPEVATALRDRLAGSPKDAKVWPGTWAEKGAEMLRRDLERACVPYRDPDGRVRDFHSLRHRFGSELARANVPPKVAQTLMRHSTITLTMDRYSHAENGDLRAGLAKLPMTPIDISPSPSASRVHRADVFSGPVASLPDAKAPEHVQGDMSPEPRENRAFDASCRVETASDVIAPGRIRTCDRRIRNPSPAKRKGKTADHLRLLTFDLASRVHRAEPIDSGLRELTDVWADLPESVRAGILATARATRERRAGKAS